MSCLCCELETNLRMERGRLRHFGKNHNLPYENRDILEKSGQSLSPCVDVNG